MSLEDLRRKLDELRRKRAGQPQSLESLLYKASRCSRQHIHVPDPLMDFPTLEQAKLFLKLDKTDELPFIEHRWDCDNFAGALYGRAQLYSLPLGKNWAFGICESDKYNGHRFNTIVVKPKRVLWIEPQDDTFFTKTGRFKFIIL